MNPLLGTPLPVAPGYESILLRARLRRRLLALPFDGFARVLSELLTKIGYKDVRPTGRRSYRGRNQHSGGVFAGFDLVASLPEPDMPGGAFRSVPRPVVIALKQYPPTTRVWQKQVDGLRGAALRVGAAEALLITTSSFSPSVTEARGAAGAVNPGTAGNGVSATVSLLASRSAGDVVAPVRLVDGNALLELLVAHGVGVTDAPEPIPPVKAPDLRVDDGYFDRVRVESSGRAGGSPLQSGSTAARLW